MILWRGIHKLVEECGELLAVLGKLNVVPAGKHWDERYAPPLKQRLVDEMGDVYAALDYLAETNLSWDDRELVQARRLYKLTRFREWVLTGAPEQETK